MNLKRYIDVAVRRELRRHLDSEADDAFFYLRDVSNSLNYDGALSANSSFANASSDKQRKVSVQRLLGEIEKLKALNDGLHRQNLDKLNFAKRYYKKVLTLFGE